MCFHYESCSVPTTNRTLLLLQYKTEGPFTPGMYLIRVAYINVMFVGFVATLRGTKLCCWWRYAGRTEWSLESKHLWKICDQIIFLFVETSEAKCLFLNERKRQRFNEYILFKNKIIIHVFIFILLIILTSCCMISTAHKNLTGSCMIGTA
jgi:hypothetical protein